MPFLAYFVVLIIAVGGALFGIGVITAPLPGHKAARPLISSSSAPNKLAKRKAARAENDAAANKTLTPIYPADPGGRRTIATPPPSAAETTSFAPAPNQVAETVPQAGNQGTESALKPADVSSPQQPSATTNTTYPAAQLAPLEHQVAQAVTQKTAGNCDIGACAGAYRSFRASDCSYQPFEGRRRTCVAPHTAQTRNEPGSELAWRGAAHAAISLARAPRYEELRGREDDDATDAPIDYDTGRVIFFPRPRGLFR